jgi:hypothetical protein
MSLRGDSTVDGTNVPTEHVWMIVRKRLTEAGKKHAPTFSQAKYIYLFYIFLQVNHEIELFLQARFFRQSFNKIDIIIKEMTGT